jgi:ABC-2 type transport system ATP-binding protein
MRQVVLDLIREAAEGGATVLLSSHDLSEVAAICGRAAILRDGKLVEMAPIAQIVRRGEHRLKVWFADSRLTPTVPLETLSNARVVEQEPGVLHLAYQGQVDPVLKWLAQFVVERMTTPQTSLQEAFIEYYRQPNGVTGRADAGTGRGDA